MRKAIVQKPWYIATETFTSRHDGWTNYIAWSGLTQLDEVVSLDPMRALEVQSELRRKYPEEPHANCHVWAIFRTYPR